MADILLQTRSVRVHFPIKRGLVFDKTVGHVRAVDGMDVTVYRGETYGLVGESGCGKSTFGRAVLNLEETATGEVNFDGVDVLKLKGDMKSPILWLNCPPGVGKTSLGKSVAKSL